MAGIRINEARNFAGQAYATQLWVNEQLAALGPSVSAGNGLSLDENAVMSVLIDGASESYLTVGTDGLKLTGIDTLKTQIEANTAAIETLTLDAIHVGGGNGIEVTGDTTYKTIAIKLADGENILTATEDGLSAGVSLLAVTEGLEDSVSKKYILVGADGSTQLGNVAIEIPKDQFLQSATYSNETHVLTFVFVLADGTTQETPIDLSGLVDVYTAGNGISIAEDGKVSVAVADSSESFLSVTEDGVKVTGIQDAIDEAVASVKGSTGTAVQLVASTITIEAGTSGEWTSESITGRVIHVSDASGVIYPQITYSDNTVNCTTTLSADFGTTPIEEDETWYVITAQPISVLTA